MIVYNIYLDRPTLSSKTEGEFKQNKKSFFFLLPIRFYQPSSSAQLLKPGENEKKMCHCNGK